LRRTQQDTLTNPVTSLPEGELVDEKLSQHISSGRNSGLMVVSLNNLEIFRDHYGFVASDDVMRAVSLMLQNAMRETGTAEDFIGHLSGTDFVLALEPGSLPIMEERVRTRLEQSLDYFYPIKDRDQVMSRKNRLAVQIGILALSGKQFSTVDDLKKALLASCK
jgi:GGDEF domain-containing protein